MPDKYNGGHAKNALLTLMNEGGMSNPKNPHDEFNWHDDQDGDGDTGHSGSSGEIQFRYKDAYSVDPRDDVLPQPEIDRLLVIHKELHKDLVEKQKATKENYLAMKNGQTAKNAAQYSLGRHGGATHSSSWQFKENPRFKGKPKGMRDKQVDFRPTELDATSNEALRDRLENRLENKLQLQQQPKFNPKPHFP